MPSLLDYAKPDVLAALRDQRARTLATLEDLAPSQWECPVLPGWRVRETVAHLIATDEAALTGRLVRLGVHQARVEDLEAWNETQLVRWADRPVPSLLWGLEMWGRRMARAVASGPRALLRRRIPTPFGRVSALWMVMLRVYGEWVHLEDVRRALGLPADHSSDSVQPVARHLLAGIPLYTLPRISPNARGRVALDIDDVAVPRVTYDLDRRRFGAGGIDSASIVSSPAHAIVMVAAGRDDWREAESRGDIRVAGERPPAEAFLDALLLV